MSRPGIEPGPLTQASVVGGDHSSKELLELHFISYWKHLHMSPWQYHKKGCDFCSWSLSNGHMNWNVTRTRVWWELQHWRGVTDIELKGDTYPCVVRAATLTKDLSQNSQPYTVIVSPSRAFIWDRQGQLCQRFPGSVYKNNWSLNWTVFCKRDKANWITARD